MKPATNMQQKLFTLSRKRLIAHPLSAQHSSPSLLRIAWFILPGDQLSPAPHACALLQGWTTVSSSRFGALHPYAV
jgi:hypothetical protein